MRPSRLDGGGVRRRTHRRISLLLPRLDLSPRRPPQGRAAPARLSVALRSEEPRTSRCGACRESRAIAASSSASLAEDGPSLEDFLGHMTTSFDDMIDRAPDGELEVAGGMFKHTYKGNWKLYLENLCDAAHPLFVHQSSIDAAQQQSDDAHSGRIGRDRDPADAPERRALQLLGGQGRHLDLSQRPQLPRRLSRRCQARRRPERSGVSRLRRRHGGEEGQGADQARFSIRGAGTATSIPISRS